MSAILYGNLRAEIMGSGDVRLQRVTLRQATHDLLRPSQPVAGKPLMLGREREAAAAFAAIRAGRPAGFHAGCGYGKTTLLRNIAAIASERSLAPSCVYLRADGDRVADLLKDLVARFYAFDQPVKPTPQECAQLLGQVSAVIVIDDLSTSPEQVGYLLDVLSGCSLVIGSAQPVLGRRGSSWKLDGLSDESALALVIGDVGRPLTAGEFAAARRLVAAVEGQPLRLRQCAALAREGRHPLGELARQAAHDPEILDRLSISALAQHERRALAVLALATGTLLPANVVEAVGQIAYVAQWLESLHRRGLAEQRHDRFGLPACKAQNTLRVMPSAVTITPAALPTATAGIQYSQQFIGAGGTAPYTFSWSGTLPPGLSLSTAGLLSGIPAAAGSYQFTVTAADSLVPSNRGSAIYTLQVTPVITLSPLSLPPEPATCPSYNVQISASGGTAPYTFSWSGTPPPGLSLSSTGLISGSPDLKDSGSYQFTVTATDHSPSPSQGSVVYTLDVYC